MQNSARNWLHPKLQTGFDGQSVNVDFSLHCTYQPDSRSAEFSLESIHLNLNIGVNKISAKSSNSASCRISWLTRAQIGQRADVLILLKQSASVVEEKIAVKMCLGTPLFGAIPLTCFYDDLNALHYIAANYDLCQIFGLDTVGARIHYNLHGEFEGRMLRFDFLNYIASYADLFHLAGDERAALEHYIVYGVREGRKIQFSPAVYLAKNPDLKPMLDGNDKELALHYIKYGFSEGRRCC